MVGWKDPFPKLPDKGYVLFGMCLENVQERLSSMCNLQNVQIFVGVFARKYRRAVRSHRLLFSETMLHATRKNHDISCPPMTSKP